MRKVLRGDRGPPAALSRLNRQKKSELDRARAHAKRRGKRKKAFEFNVYKDPEVKTRLEQLFHGKCAYCEGVYAATAPVDVEHFRPKGGTEDGGAGYWWLAMVWENLLPSCIDCNRRREQELPAPSASLVTLCATTRHFNHGVLAQAGKGVNFPIQGPRAKGEKDDLTVERPLLIDPTRDTPSDHIAFNVAEPGRVALAYPVAEGEGEGEELSLRGAMSIQTYGLNRLGLVQERTRIVRQLEFLEVLLCDVAEVIAKLKATPAFASGELDAAVAKLDRLRERILGEMRQMTLPSAPYSVTAREWIAAFKVRRSIPPPPTDVS
jgi:hypothetical protein